MTLDVTDQPKQKRPFGFVVLGVFMLGIAGILFYDLRQQPAETLTVTPSAYSYKVQQSVDTAVHYFQSSFYGDSPGAGNTAYVADLTKSIDATLHYNYKASRSAELSTMYSAVVTVQAKYTLGADQKNISKVWSREFPLIKPVVETHAGKNISFEPSVTMPFAEYRKMLDQFKTALAVPITSDAAIVFTVRVNGTIDGTPFDDIRVSTVSMPLDQPLFTLATKFEKEDSKQVVTAKVKDTQDAVKLYEKIAIGVFAVLGLASIVYGVRRQIFKTPYQRELDRIYRYHDGIIIRANKPTDLEDRKIVSVQSFDDMLNLEEEIKVPIVASPAGGDAMHFIIMRDDVAYVYTLGRVLLEDDTISELERNLPEDEAPRRKKIPRRKIQ